MTHARARERRERAERARLERTGVSPGVVRSGLAWWQPDTPLRLAAYGGSGIAVLGGAYPAAEGPTRFVAGHWIVGAGDRPSCRTGRAAGGEIAVTLPLGRDDLEPSALPVEGARLVDAVPENPLARTARGPDGVAYPTGEPVLESYFDGVLSGAQGIGGRAMFEKRVR